MQICDDSPLLRTFFSWILYSNIKSARYGHKYSFLSRRFFVCSWYVCVELLSNICCWIRWPMHKLLFLYCKAKYVSYIAFVGQNSQSTCKGCMFELSVIKTDSWRVPMWSVYLVCDANLPVWMVSLMGSLIIIHCFKHWNVGKNPTFIFVPFNLFLHTCMNIFCYLYLLFLVRLYSSKISTA